MSDNDTHQTEDPPPGFIRVERLTQDEVEKRYPPTRAAIVYGVCRDCGRANRLLSRDTRTCVVEVYDKEAGAYVMRSNPACRGAAG